MGFYARSAMALRIAPQRRSSSRVEIGLKSRSSSTLFLLKPIQ
jgi:hypothetical protein